MSDALYNLSSAVWQLRDTLQQQVIPLLEQNSVNQFKIIELLERIAIISVRNNDSPAYKIRD